MVVYSVLVKKYNNKVQKNEQNKFVSIERIAKYSTT